MPSVKPSQRGFCSNSTRQPWLVCFLAWAVPASEPLCGRKVRSPGSQSLCDQGGSSMLGFQAGAQSLLRPRVHRHGWSRVTLQHLCAELSPRIAHTQVSKKLSQPCFQPRRAASAASRWTPPPRTLGRTRKQCILLN